MVPIVAAALISAAVSAVSAGVGMWKSYKAKKAQTAELDAQKAEQEKEKAKLAQQEAEQKSWYLSERNTPTMEREENRAAMSAATEAAEEQNRKAESRAAIMGGSSEAAVAQRASNMKIIGGMARDIAAAGTRYRQQLDSQYHGMTAQNAALRAQNAATGAKLSASYMDALGQQSDNASQLTSNGISAFGSSVTEVAKNWKTTPEA